MKDELTPTPEFEEKVRKALDVPGASPEFVNRLRSELARRPANVKPKFLLKPAWVIAIALAVLSLIASSPATVNALKKLFGYVPGVGLVENTGDLRILDQSYSMTRDGVTLTISYVLVDSDHVEVIYDVQGIAADNDGSQASDYQANPKAFCGGVVFGDTYNKEGDPILKLPDGTLLERDLTGKYPQNVFSMKPVYEARVPADVMTMTFTLKCIPNARLGAVPENWEIPFHLNSVPADMVYGSPVIEVEQTAVAPAVEAPASSSTDEPAFPAPVVTMNLTRVVPLDTGYVFYISFNVENQDPSLISIMPANVYVLDSRGEKIYLYANYTWQPFEHLVGSEFEFTLQPKPVGPVTIVVENAVAIYAPLYSDPPQAIPDEMNFTFNVGENPQYGQTWPVDKEIEIAGYPIRITSVRAANYDDVKTPELEAAFGSQGFEYGYDFSVETDPSVKFQVEMEIMSESYVCTRMNGDSINPDSSNLHYVQLCRDTYPKGEILAQIWQLSVLVENTWRLTWTP